LNEYRNLLKNVFLKKIVGDTAGAELKFRLLEFVMQS